MKFILIDAANLFNRAFYVCQGDAYTKAGMALHIIFNSLDKAFRQHGANHLVLCNEGKSWRYDLYPEYKAKRKIDRNKLSIVDAEEQQVFYDVLKEFSEFMKTKTRCTVLQMQGAEADDLIARYIQLHPNDSHMILSGDSDMIQLVDTNVSVFNGMTNTIITDKGVFDEKGNELYFSIKTTDGKLKIEKPIQHMKKLYESKNKDNYKNLVKQETLEKNKLSQMIREECSNSEIDKQKKILSKANIAVLQSKKEMDTSFEFSFDKDLFEMSLFLKCIRGDAGDGIFSAYPGVRFNGTTKKVGIKEAWEDRKQKGFHWNNFMLQKWNKMLPDGSTKDVTVMEEYERNVSLIDLRMQPDHIKDKMDTTIVEAIQKEPVGNVGFNFLSFCNKFELKRLAERANDHIRYLNAGYK